MKRTVDIKGILIGSAVLIAVIAVLIIVIVVLNRKRKVETAVLPQETDWGKTLTESESATIERIAKGLYDEIVRAQLKTEHLVENLALGGDHDHRL